MIITGFTIIRNAIKNDYPIVEAITSILPIVDEMIVLVGQSDDETEELIRSINSSKIKIHYSVWNTGLQSGGVVLAQETNKALAFVDPTSDWAFYIQADEVIHEKYHSAIVEGCTKYKDDDRVEGLLFKYVHFYGSYQYVGDSRKWYSHEVRIIRPGRGLTAYRDAQGFRNNGERIAVKKLDTCVYHYGWVKTRENMIAKMKNVTAFWAGNQQAFQKAIASNELFSFNDYDSVSHFSGTHPQVMQKRISERDHALQLDVNRKNLSFKDRIMYFIEKITGKRFFEFKNYRTLRG